ncbi:MAG: Uma2 family endonuclease [Acidimicrobiales bacterium]
MKTASELAEIQAVVYDDVPRGWRVDVLGGQLIVNPPASPNHNRIARLLDAALDSARPADLAVTSQGDGFYAPDDECWVPDIAVFASRCVNAARYQAADLVLAVEVLSPSNRHGGYLTMMIDRQRRFGCKWLAIVDPAARTITWYDAAGQAASGPAWAGGIRFPVGASLDQD